MPDEQVREPRPVGTRDDALEITLDLHRILVPRQAEALREPSDVRVHHDALRVTELGCHDVGRLARDAGKPQEVLEASRHLAVELLEQDAHRPADRLRLLAVEARREDVLLQLLDGHGEVVLGAPILLEELLGDAVDVHVGGLRGKHHRDQQLDVAPEAQRDRRVGVLPCEALDDRPDPVAAAAEPPPPRLADVATRHAGARTRRSPTRR